MRAFFDRLGVLAVAVLLAAPFAANAPAAGADTSVDIPLTCVSTAPVAANGTLTIGTSVPDTVTQGSTFALDVTPSGFFSIPAPFPGTISATFALAVSPGATPSGPFVLTLASQHFDQGAMVPFPTFTESFVASGTIGTVIDFTFSQFEYTITPDPGPASFTVTCTPTAEPAPIVASTMIVGNTCDGRAATIVGTPGDDVILGTSRADVIDSLGGNDIVHGLAGDDVICTGDGADTISGDSGHDVVFAGVGADVVDAGSGNDRVAGEAGDDTLRGESGADQLDGGAHTGTPGDTCDGGSGIDVASNCEVLTAIP